MALEKGTKIAWAPRKTGVIAGLQDGNSSGLPSWDSGILSSTSYKSFQRGQDTRSDINPKINTGAIYDKIAGSLTWAMLTTS